MDLIIDGLNLVYKFPSTEERIYRDDLNGAKQNLISILDAYRKVSKLSSIQIFWDGKKEKTDLNTFTEEIQDMKIHYSHKQKADDLMIHFLLYNEKPWQFTTVTSDKEILKVCRKLRSPHMTSEEFSAKVQESLGATNAL